MARIARESRETHESHYLAEGIDEVHATLGVTFVASPLGGGKRTKVRGFELPVPVALDKPSPSPLPARAR
jgi:hypothetical protein